MLRMQSFILFSIVLAFPAFMSGAHAATVTATFTGTVTSVNAFGTSVPSGVSTGQTISGTFSYDTSDPNIVATPIGNPFTCCVSYTSYQMPTTGTNLSFSIDIGGQTWASGPDFYVGVINDRATAVYDSTGSLDPTVQAAGDGMYFQTQYGNPQLAYIDQWDHQLAANTTQPLSFPGMLDAAAMGFSFGNGMIQPISTDPTNVSNLFDSEVLPDFTSGVTPTTATGTFDSWGHLSTGSNNGTDWYEIGFQIDPASFSFGTVVQPPPPSPTVIYLDFDSGTNMNIVQNVFQGVPVEILDPFGSSSAPLPTSAAARKTIANRIQTVFAAAGMPVTVVSSDDPNALQILAGAANQYTVEYGAGKQAGSTISGYAYDVNNFLSNPFQPDRFDKRKDGTVAVFYDLTNISIAYPNLNPLDIVADATAHELGHAFGLKHIEAGLGLGEVMDYDKKDTNITSFFSGVAPIVFNFNKDGSVAAFDGETHNPLYHLLANAGGFTSTQLSNLTPGTYDVASSIVANLQASFTNLAGVAQKIYMGTGPIIAGSGNTTPSGFQTGNTLVDVTGYLNGWVLDFSMDSSQPISFFGSTGSANMIDLVLGDLSNFSLSRQLTFQDLTTGNLGFFGYDSFSGTWNPVSPVTFHLTSTSTITPNEIPSPVPLPPTGILLMVPLLGLSTLGWKQQANKLNHGRKQQTSDKHIN